MKYASEYFETAYPKTLHKFVEKWIVENDYKIVRIVSINYWYSEVQRVNCCAITYTENN